MALSITELELQSTEYLPAREVMTSFGRAHGHDVDPSASHVSDGSDGNDFEGGILNNVNVQDVLNSNDINVQVGLVNVLVEEIQASVPIGSATEDAMVQGPV